MSRLLPRSRPVIEALQWFGLLVPALVFSAEHVIGLGSTLAQCNPAGSHWSIEPHLYQLTTAAVAAGIVVVAEAAALLAFLATRSLHYEDDPPLGRVRFLSTAALVSGPLFLCLILLNGIGAAVQPLCHQA